MGGVLIAAPSFASFFLYSIYAFFAGGATAWTPAMLSFLVLPAGGALIGALTNWNKAYIENLQLVCQLLGLKVEKKPAYPWYDVCANCLDYPVVQVL